MTFGKRSFSGEVTMSARRERLFLGAGFRVEIEWGLTNSGNCQDGDTEEPV